MFVCLSRLENYENNLRNDVIKNCGIQICDDGRTFLMANEQNFNLFRWTKNKTRIIVGCKKLKIIRMPVVNFSGIN